MGDADVTLETKAVKADVVFVPIGGKYTMDVDEAAGFNIIWTAKGKDAKWFRFISLSLTVLALCAFYSQSAVWVLHKDWGALEDVIPSMSRGLWVLTLISIALNSISLIKQKNR